MLNVQENQVSGIKYLVEYALSSLKALTWISILTKITKLEYSQLHVFILYSNLQFNYQLIACRLVELRMGHPQPAYIFNYKLGTSLPLTVSQMRLKNY